MTSSLVQVEEVAELLTKVHRLEASIGYALLVLNNLHSHSEGSVKKTLKLVVDVLEAVVEASNE